MCALLAAAESESKSINGPTHLAGKPIVTSTKFPFYECRSNAVKANVYVFLEKNVKISQDN